MTSGVALRSQSVKGYTVDNITQIQYKHNEERKTITKNDYDVLS